MHDTVRVVLVFGSDGSSGGGFFRADFQDAAKAKPLGLRSAARRNLSEEPDAMSWSLSRHARLKSLPPESYLGKVGAEFWEGDERSKIQFLQSGSVLNGPDLFTELPLL